MNVNVSNEVLDAVPVLDKVNGVVELKVNDVLVDEVVPVVEVE